MASIPGPILDWGPDCYGWEPGYASHMSQTGASLTWVGKIDNWITPLDALADFNTYEYTFVFKDMISRGSVVITPNVRIDTYYDGGTFEIYQDAAKNAAFGTNPPSAVSPATFTDGTLILTGTLGTGPTALYVTNRKQGPFWVGTYSLQYDVTGPSGSPFFALLEGCYGTSGTLWYDGLPASIPAGYTMHVDGHMTVTECRPTATEASDWGSVKMLFR
jgi:hypothetical protein